jgi:hypothetical protein
VLYESESYGEFDPIKPWRGKLRIITRHGEQVLYLHRFNCETGEIDEDSNATSFVKEDEFFETRAAANEFYRTAAIHAARSHIQSADELLESCGKLPPDEDDNEREH